MKRKKAEENERKGWGTRISRLQFRGLIGLTVLGPMAIVAAPYGFWHGEFAAAFGSLLLGLGVMAATSCLWLCRFRDLTPKGLWYAEVISRVGMMGLGPAAALILQPWREAQMGVLTTGQCVAVCAFLCGLTLVTYGISLACFLLGHGKR